MEFAEKQESESYSHHLIKLMIIILSLEAQIHHLNGKHLSLFFLAF